MVNIKSEDFSAFFAYSSFLGGDIEFLRIRFPLMVTVMKMITNDGLLDGQKKRPLLKLKLSSKMFQMLR